MQHFNLTDAIKNIRVHLDDWLFFSSAWEVVEGSFVQDYYAYLFLPFSMHSFLALLNKHTNTLEYAVQVNNVANLLHYPDVNHM